MIGSNDENLFEEEIGKMQSMLNNNITCSKQLTSIQKKESIQIIDSKANKNILVVDTINDHSSNNDNNSINISSKNSNESNISGVHSEKPVLKKPFSFEEDELLLSLVNSLGDKKDWILISFYMKKFNYERSSRQCRDRYVHYLDPKIINNVPWSPEDDNLLIKTVEKQGKKWKILEKTFPGRSEVALRNRYHLLLRKMVKSKQNKEKKANIMSDKFAFLDNFYQKNIKSQNSQRRREKKKSFPIAVDHKNERITKIFNESDLFSFGDEHFADIDIFDESIFMYE